MVIWIIGMSGAGKTTVGRELVRHLKAETSEPWVLLDGDDVRNLFGESAGFTLEGRRLNGERLTRLCRFYDRQQLNVVACVLSVFPDMQISNRTDFQSYRQVYLKASLDLLRKRDNKNIYEAALRGEARNVVGVDIPFPDPVQNDLTIDLDHDISPPEVLAVQIAHSLELVRNPEHFLDLPLALEERKRVQESLATIDSNGLIEFYRKFRKLTIDTLFAPSMSSECLTSLLDEWPSFLGGSDMSFDFLLERYHFLSGIDFDLKRRESILLLDESLKLGDFLSAYSCFMSKEQKTRLSISLDLEIKKMEKLSQ